MSNSTGKLGKRGFVLGVITAVLAMLPLISVWFLVITSWLVPLLAVIGLVLGVIAYVKKQPKAIHAVVACVAAFALFVFVNNSDAVEKKAEKAAAGLVKDAIDDYNRYDD